MTISTISREYVYKFKLSLRRTLPKSNIYYLLFYFFKYASVILYTHSISTNEGETQLYTLSKILNSFMIFRKNPKINYVVLCIVLYVILSFVSFSFLFVFICYYLNSKKTDQKVFDIPKNNLNLKPWIKKLQRVNCFLFSVINFFYQHIFEILFYGIFYVLCEDANYRQVNKDNLISYNFRYLYCILNSVFIIILLGMLYIYLQLISTKTFTCRFGVQVPNSNFDVAVKITFFSFQGFYSCSFFFEEKHRKDLHLYLCCISLFLLVIDLIISLKQVNFASSSIVDFFNKFLRNFCIISGVIELLIHFCLKNKNTNDQNYYLFFLFIEVLNAFIMTWFISYLQSQKGNERLAVNLFSMNKNCNINDLLEFFLQLNKKKTEKEKYLFIIGIIQIHQSKCTFEVCECHKYDRKFLLNQENKVGKINQKFTALCERKIINIILHPSNTDRANYCQALLFHCDYLFSIKTNHTLCFYLTHYYLLKRINDLDKESSYMLFELSWLIKTYERCKETKNDAVFLKEIFGFEKIKRYLSVICSEIEKILYFKALKNSNSKLLFSCKDILEAINNFIVDNKKLSGILNEQSKRSTFSYSPEIQFLLFYYIKLFHIYLPKAIRSKIYSGTIEFPSCAEIMESNNDTKNTNFFIVFLNPDNKFIIRHCSVEICEDLEYDRSELISSDFNDVFLPKEISQFHSIYMKEFTLIDKNCDYIKNTFFFDKNGKLFPVKVTCKVLPTTSAIYAMIIYCDYIQQNQYSNYYIMNDEYKNIISISDSFEKQFFFGLKMMQTLKFDICEFFCLNRDKIRNYFYSKLKEMGTPSDKNKFKPFCLTTLKPDEKFYYQNMLKYPLNFDNNTINLSEPLTKTEIVQKDKILASLLKFEKNFESLGLEKEWKGKINELYEKLKCNFVVVEEEGANNFILKFHFKLIGNFRYYIITISELRLDEYSGIKYKKKQKTNFDPTPKGVNNSFLNSFHYEYGDPSLFPFESSMTHNFITNTTQNFNSSSFQSQMFTAKNTNDSSAADLVTAGKNSQLRKRLVRTEDYTKSNFAESYESLSKLTALFPFIKLGEIAIIISIFGLNLSYFLTNSSSNRESLNIFYTSTYSFLIVADIYYGSFVCLALCLSKDGIQELDVDLVKNRLIKAGAYLIDHHVSFQSFVNNIQNKEQMKEIYKIYNENDLFNQLLPDWTVQAKNSSLIEEVYFIYYSYRTFTNNNVCRIKDMFLGKKFLDLDKTKLEEGDYATSEERFMYYIFDNGLRTITQKLEKLTKVSFSILMQNTEDSNVQSVAFGLIIISGAIVLIFLIVSSILMSRTIFKAKLKYLFTKHQNESLFFNEVKNYHLLVDKFQRKDSDDYTNYKRSLFNSDGYLNLERNQGLIFMGKKVDSVNIQFEAKKTKVKGKKRVSSIRSDKKTTEEIASENEKIETTEKLFEQKISPKHLTYSIIAVVIVFAIFLTEEISSLMTSDEAYRQSKIENRFSSNMLQRIPKFYELLLYAIISVIRGDHLWLTEEPSNYDDGILSNYYNVKIDMSSDSYFKNLGNSNYAKLYYQLQVITNNIDYLINSQKMKKYLKRTSEKEFSFYEKEYFCVNNIHYFFQNEMNELDTIEFYTTLNTAIRQCRKVGNGINLSGEKVALDLMQLQLANSYFGFIENDSPNRQLEFLSDSNVVVIEENFLYSLQYLHFTDAFLVIEDISGTYSESHSLKVFFSFISIFLSSGVILGVIAFAVAKMEHYNSVVSDIVKMFEKAIKKYNK